MLVLPRSARLSPVSVAGIKFQSGSRPCLDSSSSAGLDALVLHVAFSCLAAGWPRLVSMSVSGSSVARDSKLQHTVFSSLCQHHIF